MTIITHTVEELLQAPYNRYLTAEERQALIKERDALIAEIDRKAVKVFTDPGIEAGDLVRMPRGYLNAGLKVRIVDVTSDDTGHLVYSGTDPRGWRVCFILPSLDRELNPIYTARILEKVRP